MDSFSADTLLSASHSSRSGTWLPAPRPMAGRAAHPCSWHSSGDSLDPLFIAPFSEPDYPHIKFRQTYAPQRVSTHFNLLYPHVCPPTPPSSSSSKSTIPLPEDADAAIPFYSTHLAGVLDSPPVVRREELVSQKPLTPPPTIPQPTHSLPDVDIPADDHDVEGIREECELDECPSTASPQPVQTVLPLSPLSPSWDPPSEQALPMAQSQVFTEPERLNALFSPNAPPTLGYYHPSPISPHQPSPLLKLDPDPDVDTLGPFWPSIGMPWTSDEPTKNSDPEPPSPSSSSSSLISLTDCDELPPPSSPLIPRLSLPNLEDDGLPKIVPSSPSRRSCSRLPDFDVEMGSPCSDPVQTLTGQQLISLPGADTDDDLIPRFVPSRPVPLAPSQPLLFIDDPRDIPLPRSPSPEEPELRLSPEDITDPELAKLFDLRKRSIAAERAARRMEMLTEVTDLFGRAEARKTRKRERERSKELGALLRLKLGDTVAPCPQEQQSPECDSHNQTRRRGVIGDMSQLVAQMVFRRNETSRPLAKRKTANVVRGYAPSPLSDAKVDE